MRVDARTENGKLIITLDLEAPRPSKSSGKTLIVASSRGVQDTTAKVKGQTVYVSANAFIYPRSKRGEAKEHSD